MIDKSKYVLDPLGPERRTSLESRIKRRIPDALWKVLSEIGFQQNAIAGDWAQDEKSFVRMQKMIPEGHVAFMGDGCGNYHVISDDGMVMLWDHDIDQVQPENCTFDEFIARKMMDPQPLEAVSWHVQLSFDCHDDAVIRDVLAKSLGLTFTGAWRFQETSSAGVSSYTLAYTSADCDGMIDKMTHKTWEWDIVTMDIAVPIHAIGRYRTIFSGFDGMKDIRFKLVDYGILPTDLDEDED